MHDAQHAAADHHYPLHLCPPVLPRLTVHRAAAKAR
jgi:hypothetical protein